MPVPKRGSSKRKQESPPPSEEQLAEMYATPDMTQKSRNKNTAPPVSVLHRLVRLERKNTRENC